MREETPRFPMRCKGEAGDTEANSVECVKELKELDRRRASFETAAVRLPQDDEKP
jgi:hypothetical protein